LLNDERGFLPRLHSEVQTDLQLNLNYSHLWLAVDCYKWSNRRQVERLHVHGVVGLLPSDYTQAKELLADHSGDWSSQGRRVQLDPISRVSGWACYATKTVEDAKLITGGSCFSKTQEITRRAVSLYEARCDDQDVWDALARVRLCRVPQSRADPNVPPPRPVPAPFYYDHMRRLNALACLEASS
jgi:hypothetical protein